MILFGLSSTLVVNYSLLLLGYAVRDENKDDDSDDDNKENEVHIPFCPN